MRIQGLKFHISTTLAMLLTIGMMLLVFVMLMLWQRDVLRLELEHSRTLVSLLAKQAISVNSAPVPGHDGKDAQPQLPVVEGSVCTMLVTDNRVALSAPRKCEQFQKIVQVVRQAATSGKEVAVVTTVGPKMFLPAGNYIAAAAPLPGRGQGSGRVGRLGGHGALGLLFPIRSTFQTLADNIRIILVYLLINVLILTVIGFFRLAKFVVRPIEKLVALSDSYAEDVDGINFLSVSEKNEFGRLSSALHRMIQRIEADREKLRATVESLEEANTRLHETRQEMVHAEKMASVGRLAAGLAHEIGNPLGIIQGYLDFLTDDQLDADEKKEFYRRADQELQRIHLLIRQLLDFSRPTPVQSQEVSLHELILDLTSMVGLRSRLRDIEIVTDFRADPDTVWGSPDQLKQVLLNCLLNAADAILAKKDKKGRIDIQTKIIGKKTGAGKDRDFIRLEIRDNGIGIAADDMSLVFDPFFTTKEPGQGTGLGLSVSHAIIKNMKGTITVAGEEGKGAKIIIELPVCRPSDKIDIIEQ